ncbi:glycosyltransferase involved in cell wall biosynthesis [Pseudoduganella flava]|uniref:Glycosyltransferase n=1 Tax=Pseudoduganella flava TaxID=871742 RepID=A0A562PCJ8_9BURK|nr:glycosyltransferase [Pseudoduganella flava]QGZ40174.1 glycosyltransferase [Pseudoduganella flava]TWI42128.1 glycosyltransferase involved in cell wall biosynthesis [Pseudoduganella flava]
MTTRNLDLSGGTAPANPFHADEALGVAADLVVEPIPHPDNSFDYLCTYELPARVPRLLYAPQRRLPFVELMNEAWRVLKPGGHFLVMSAGPAAVGDPAVVNPIDEHTFPRHFGRDGVTDGFTGAFETLRQEWRGDRLFAVLRKVEAAAARAPSGGSMVSVVIPVYNGERYIGQTLESVLAQAHPDFEVLCVDDHSTDGSLALLQDYARRDARVRVLQTPHNLGTASRALNHALPQMRGDFFVYSSQDDLFSTDWLSSMVARAHETGADAVIPNVVLHYPGDPSRDRILSGLRGDRTVELSGRDAAQHSLDWSIPGNALWRANLVRFFGFAEFGLNADEYSARLFFINANKVVFSDGIFYYRQDNPAAVTKRFTPKSFDYAYTQLRVYQLLAAEGYPAAIVQQEALKTLGTRNQLQQWLDEQGPANFTPEQRRQAQERLDRVTAAMRRDPMFAAVI